MNRSSLRCPCHGNFESTINIVHEVFNKSIIHSAEDIDREEFSFQAYSDQRFICVKFISSSKTCRKYSSSTTATFLPTTAPSSPSSSNPLRGRKKLYSIPHLSLTVAKPGGSERSAPCARIRGIWHRLLVNALETRGT